MSFVNHSFDPNIFAFQLAGRVYYRALREILPGEELFVDYGHDYGKTLAHTGE